MSEVCTGLGTWAADVLQVAQARLPGQPVEQLAGFAVLVAGRQLQRGQLLGRVLVQHQALVHHHARGEVVLWKDQQRRKRHKEDDEEEGGNGI